VGAVDSCIAGAIALDSGRLMGGGGGGEGRGDVLERYERCWRRSQLI
jgi:hypothetical protein